ncbi:serine/threonine-protein phosphatase 7 long form-like protein, partial [Trifolium medium]|nr:serine/threonine-protein phosphatase 7 long form-like protein [Trifolium medium]
IIQGWLNNSGLNWLERTSLMKVDPHLLSAFMTITLDDVACLLHLPVRGDFYTPVSVNMEEAAALAAELLGVTYDIRC